MLILTRRVSERLFLNDDVIIAVLAVNGNQVKIGIEAPREIEIHREEIWQKIQSEKESKECQPGLYLKQLRVV
jgi:carbon storage regulator